MKEKRKNLTFEDIQSEVQSELDRRNFAARSRGADAAHRVLEMMTNGKYQVAQEWEMRWFEDYSAGIRLSLRAVRSFDVGAFQETMADAGYPDVELKDDTMTIFGISYRVIVPIVCKTATADGD